MAYPGTHRATFNVGAAELTVTRDAGPRIVSYSSGSTEQLFANLPEAFIDHANLDPYRFIGGHRLWRAPEIPAVTYERDDRPVMIHESESVLELVGSPDRDGVVKVMSAKAFKTMTIIDHTLHNGGDHPVTTAVWAITQLSPGGVGVLPQTSDAVDDDGVLPNRSVVMWPYTDPSEADIAFGADDIRISGTASPRKVKVGTQNAMGWIAYHLRNGLFVKWSPVHDDAKTYPDRGSSIECYRDQRFVELETLGPIVTLEPGGDVRHREVWQMFDVTNDSADDVLASLPVEPEAMRS